MTCHQLPVTHDLSIMNAFVRLWEVTKRGRVLAGDKYVLCRATLPLLAMANNVNWSDWQERHQKWNFCKWKNCRLAETNLGFKTNSKDFYASWPNIWSCPLQTIQCLEYLCYNSIVQHSWSVCEETEKSLKLYRPWRLPSFLSPIPPKTEAEVSTVMHENWCKLAPAKLFFLANLAEGHGKRSRCCKTSIHLTSFLLLHRLQFSLHESSLRFILDTKHKPGPV